MVYIFYSLCIGKKKKYNFQDVLNNVLRSYLDKEYQSMNKLGKVYT